MAFIEDTRVLVVDDYATMRRIVTAMLQQFGITRVDHAQNGAEALELLGRNAYDVVLCDWCMETMSGEEFLRAARSAHPATPVMIISAHGSQPIMDAAKALGAKRFLQKPFSVDTLRAAVNEVCALNVPASSREKRSGLGGALSDLLGAGATPHPRRS